MKLSLEQVEHVAQLAQLALTDQEKDLFCEQLSSILEYAELLQQVDTGEIPPTATVLPLENILRDDQVRPSMPREEVLANAPNVEDGCFRVPVILESPGQITTASEVAIFDDDITYDDVIAAKPPLGLRRTGEG